MEQRRAASFAVADACGDAERSGVVVVDDDGDGGDRQRDLGTRCRKTSMILEHCRDLKTGEAVAFFAVDDVHDVDAVVVGVAAVVACCGDDDDVAAADDDALRQ